MIPISQKLIFAVAGVFVFFLLVSIRRRRQSIRHAIKTAFIVECAYVSVVYILLRIGRTPPEAVLGGIVVGLVFDRFIPRRSRHIPASVRRRKTAEYELRTGRKFNPKRYELDHEIPFSKGGSHTPDDLRVVEKSKNRSKGHKSPWWDLLSR
jgi:hypothetical protein